MQYRIYLATIISLLIFLTGLAAELNLKCIAISTGLISGLLMSFAPFLTEDV